MVTRIDWPLIEPNFICRFRRAEADGLRLSYEPLRTREDSIAEFLPRAGFGATLTG
jgi:hypothetical protein